jgi:2-amino-4-hydroxy-6-hydroxymethyldihydropteridine diphosphokinase
MQRTVHLALGARDGDPRAQLLRGVACLREEGIRPRALSSLWETEPVGIPAGPPVLNVALSARTDLAPRDLLATLIRLEDASGRRRTPPEWRSLDLDILLVEDLVLSEPDLMIPHPRFHARRFNLAPLCEIAPEVRHPVLGMTIRELLEACEERAWARLADRHWAAGLVERTGALG